MNKTFFYVCGLLILQLSFFGCFNPKNELNTNKADESQVYDETLSENITSNIDTTTSNNSTSKINENDPNSFTPLQEEEVLLCDYVSNNNVSIKIKNNTNKFVLIGTIQEQTTSIIIAIGKIDVNALIGNSQLHITAG